MTEKSFPVVEKAMGAAEWQTLALGFGQGIIDRGGWPYLLGPIDNVNNTVTILLDQITGVNEALLSGFAHRIDHEKVLTIPAVSTTTTYEVGLYYNPLSTDPNGPITLTVWTAPGDYSEHRNRLILYRITRNANQVLSDATIQENRQRVSPRITVSQVSDLPKVETLLVDTEARVRATNDVYRLNKATDGAITWTKANPETGLSEADVDSRIASQATAGYGSATPFELGSRIMARFPDGTARVRPPKEHWDVVNLGTLQDGLAGKASTSHTHSAGQVTSGEFSGARIRYSTWAYNEIQSGTNYTVSVNSAGKLARFSSTERHKENAELWKPAPRRLLGPDAWIYDRVDPETREVTNPREVGTIAERNLDSLPEFVQWGPDHITPEVGPEEELKVQGWDYQRWGAAHQRLHKWHAARLDAVTAAVERIAEKAGVDVSDLLEGLEWDDEGEA